MFLSLSQEISLGVLCAFHGGIFWQPHKSYYKFFLTVVWYTTKKYKAKIFISSKVTYAPV
jgi:hypothetical protein